jgi:hypothetical protein
VGESQQLYKRGVDSTEDKVETGEYSVLPVSFIYAKYPSRVIQVMTSSAMMSSYK